MTGSQNVLRYFIALVWLVNGLFCKLLDMVPRHELIVASILGDRHASLFTDLIGIAEIVMALWILSGWHRKLNGILQIITILVMNFLETIICKDLLLWGGANLFFALIFVCVVYYTAFTPVKDKP